MTDLSANIRLRPTRIGFLVRPTDMASILKIMRACACLWGGIYNPIIPVFSTPPKEWRREKHDSVKGLDVAKGYIQFFEPDVFVEAESGLLEEVGLGALREKYSLDKQVISLSEFLKPQDHRSWSEPALGLSVNDVLRDLYKKERKFKLREDRPAVLFKPEKGNGLVEALFGAYPTQKDAAYFTKSYKDVYEPEEVTASPECWMQVFKKGAITPLRVTHYELDAQRSWHHDQLIYVFDPKKPTDLIDLWNLRLESNPVLPVPVDWFGALSETISKVISAEYRPVKGNPNGVMHRPTIEFSRSIAKEQAETLAKSLKNLPDGALCIKLWRTPIWIDHADREFVHRERRMEITHKDHRTTSTVKEETAPRGRSLTASLKFLEPEFAERYGGAHNDRWVNVLRVTSSAYEEKIATVYPYNTFDRRWPPLGIGSDRAIISSEGWVFGERFKNIDKTLWLQTREDAVIGSLKERGIEAKLSEPGYIAQQMLDHLGGLWGVHLLKNIETLQLLNKMAGGLRRRSNETDTIEESFERYSAPLQDWTSLIAKRKQLETLPSLELSDFTKRNVIRLGLETICTHCQGKNWHTLTGTDYLLNCERCLNQYEFPQAGLQPQNKNWHYRVVGPFSIPDYGRGAYSALLTLEAIKNFSGSSLDEMTFSTALDLKFDSTKAEVDFVAWRRKETHNTHEPPDLIIGETKSFGSGDLIKPKDLAKLKQVGKKLPGAIIVISVLRDHFTANEKKILKKFVQWGRRLDHRRLPINPVVLLTTHELFARHFIRNTWKDLGDPHKSFSDFHYTRTLPIFAEATQAIYLGMRSLHEDRAEKWKKKASKKESRAQVKSVAPKGTS